MSTPYVSTLVTSLANGDCDVVSVTGTSAQGQAMTVGQTYRFLSSVGAWLKFGSNPTAVAATDGNVYLPPNTPLHVLCQGTATVCAAIREGAVSGVLTQQLVVM